jgi:hypothetical protein
VTREEQIKWQRQCIMEDYHNKMESNLKELQDGKSTFVSTSQVMQAGERAGEARV